MPHLLLELEDAKHERLGGGRAPGHVNINRDDSVAAARDAVAVVVVATAVGAGAHGDDPSGFGHLIVDLSQGRSHLVGKSAGDNHDVGLTGRGAENDSHSVLIVTWGRKMHHLDGAACETESHGPEGSLASPVCHLIKRGSVAPGQFILSPCTLPFFFFSFESTYSAYCIAPCFPSWLGRSTSLCGFPVTAFMGGGVPEAPLTMPPLSTAAAFLFEELEMYAAWTARGKRAAVGLAVGLVSTLVDLAGAAAVVNRKKSLPRSARAVAERVVENIVR